MQISYSSVAMPFLASLDFVFFPLFNLISKSIGTPSTIDRKKKKRTNSIMVLRKSLPCLVEGLLFVCVSAAVTVLLVLRATIQSNQSPIQPITHPTNHPRFLFRCFLNCLFLLCWLCVHPFSFLPIWTS